MELDHIFMLTTPDAPELAQLDAIGLVPTYRREHVGQGTANVCYCFDNAFLEILWVTSSVEAKNPSVARMQLAARAQWLTTQVSPFGIAWRGTPPDTSAIPTWPCTPPYLPAGIAIDVATDSDDLTQPLMFTFPGSRAPSQWPEARRGALQRAAGFTRMTVSALSLPPTVRPSLALECIAAATGAALRSDVSRGHALELRLERGDGHDALTLQLPECAPVR